MKHKLKLVIMMIGILAIIIAVIPVNAYAFDTEFERGQEQIENAFGTPKYEMTENEVAEEKEPEISNSSYNPSFFGPDRCPMGFDNECPLFNVN